MRSDGAVHPDRNEMLKWALERRRLEEAAEVAERAFSILSDVAWTTRRNDDMENMFVSRLRESLHACTRAFELLASHPCQMSIKLVSAQSCVSLEEVQVTTLCCDVDDRLRDRAGPDRIGDCSDFLGIIKDNNPHFWSNDLSVGARSGIYKSPGWDRDMIQIGDIPYVSTIVFPVGGVMRSNSRVEASVIAFVRVDTKKSHAFERDSDSLGLFTLRAAFHCCIFGTIERRFRSPGREVEEVVELNETISGGVGKPTRDFQLRHSIGSHQYYLDSEWLTCRITTSCGRNVMYRFPRMTLFDVFDGPG
jgi:hypothetical protein